MTKVARETVAKRGWRTRAVFGMSAPLPVDSEGRIHHGRMRRDGCVTHALSNLTRSVRLWEDVPLWGGFSAPA